MQFEAIKQRILQYQRQGFRLFATSSFQTHSIPLLHLLSRIDRSIPVFFLNTGYLFPETLQYKDDIAKLLNINVKGVRSSVPRIHQRTPDGRLLFTSDPDRCCYINKIQPLEPILEQYDVWINGIRADQNENRKQMKVEQRTPQGAMRFHPILNWTNRDIEAYIKEHNLPRHPLEEKEYLSIGCEPCTRKMDLDIEADPRLSRWFGLNKTECGLHTDLVKKE